MTDSSDTEETPPECDFSAAHLNVDEDILLAKDLSSWECSRPVWEQADRQRCVWHADTADKPKAELTKTVGNGDLYGAFLKETDLTGTSLIEADLTDADLRKADLSGALLNRAHVTDADLRKADLIGTAFDGADLSGADLEDADLTDGELRRADLSGANLEAADLTDAELYDSNLSGANLEVADLHGVELFARKYGVNLSGADLSDADLSSADLSALKGDVNLSGADLSDADLSGADLSTRQGGQGEVNLSGVDLSDANLIDADLSARQGEVNLTGAELISADLSDADLTDADLSDADLTDADLSDADLTDVDLSDTDLSGARFISADLSGATIKHAGFRTFDIRETPSELLPTSALFGSVPSVIEIDINWREAPVREFFMIPGEGNPATFVEAELQRADLEGAELGFADLSETTLTAADCEGTRFRNTNLNRGTLENADLTGADFSQAYLYQTRLDGAQINEETQLHPDGDVGDTSTDNACRYDSEVAPKTPTASVAVEVADNADADAKEIRARRARSTYTRLEDLARENGFPDLKSEMFIRRQDARRELLWAQGQRTRAIFARVQRALFNYGESFARVVGISAAAILIGWVLYMVTGTVETVGGTVLTAETVAETPRLGWEALYHSVSVFFAGDGPFTPTGTAGQVLTAVLRVIGPVLVALLIFVLGRRAAR